MQLIIKRHFKGPQYTIGRLFVDGVYECDTLEDTVREDGVKIAGQTAIPAGKYPVRITYSPRFKKMLPMLDNVPNFTGVRIHTGNTAADTEGCILVGYNRVKGRVCDSRAAFRRLFAKLETAEQIELKIK